MVSRPLSISLEQAGEKGAIIERKSTLVTITANNQSTMGIYIQAYSRNAKMKDTDRVPIAHLFSNALSAESFNPTPGTIWP